MPASVLLGLTCALGAGWLVACSGDEQGEELRPTPPLPPLVDVGGEGGGGPVEDAKLYPPSICQRVGDEVQLTEGAKVETVTLLWDADHYLLTYTDVGQGGGDVYTERLDANGVRQGAPVAVAPSPGVAKVPSVAKLASGGYLVAFEENATPAQVLTVVLDANGAPVGPAKVVATSPGAEARPVVASGPEGPVLAWMEGEYPATSSFVARVDPATGALVADSKKPLGGAGAGFPYVASGASALAVAFSQPAGATATIDFGLLGPSLELTGRQSLRAPAGDARLARVGRRGGAFLVAWEDFREPDEQVFMALVDQAGAKSADALVENPGTGSANWPNVASKADGSSSAVVYYQFRQRRPQIFLAYIDATGRKVGGDLQVSNTPAAAYAKYPDVQWSGSTFGVVWVDTRFGDGQAFFANVSCP
jgi:hypothetical protein